MVEHGNRLSATNTGEKHVNKGHFVKGDPRINRKGRPRDFDQARALAQKILHEPLMTANGQKLTVIEAIFRTWAKSKEPQLQKALVEYAFGRVPDKVETTGLENKTTLILHYAHEFDRMQRTPASLS